MIAKYLIFADEEVPYKMYDYSDTDSVFYSVINDTVNSKNIKKLEKIVDSEQELLDFSKDKLYQDSGFSETPLIDINSASIEQLCTLPGIGKKTAQKIIDFRKLNGKFNKVSEIMSVKGIGKVKFEKFKNKVFIK